jgi:hypothetical protein
MAHTSIVLAGRSPLARSRVSNGSDLLPGIDGRSATARRYRDLVRTIITDQGGAAQTSEARMQLERRFAAAAVLAEQMEARLANAEAIDIAEHAHLTSTMTRVAQRIGIDRRARTVVPALRDYIEGRVTGEQDEP